MDVWFTRVVHKGVCLVCGVSARGPMESSCDDKTNRCPEKAATADSLGTSLLLGLDINVLTGEERQREREREREERGEREIACEQRERERERKRVGRGRRKKKRD